jgi:hypothetical protein
VRGARRPAGLDLLLEFELKHGVKPRGLASFWLSTLWRFLEDSRQNPDAFEGLAFQAMAERLSAREFEEGYGPLRARLTLPPPYPIELRQAYRVLQGRVNSYAGITVDGELWAGFFQANVYEPAEEPGAV